MKIKRICLWILLIVISFLLNACENVNTNIENADKNNTTATTIPTSTNTDTTITTATTTKEEIVSDKQSISNFILMFLKAIYSNDSKSFKEMIDKDGIYSITYFVDGRDQNVVLHLNKDEIRNDLVLANSKKMGIGLSSMFYSDLVNEIESVPIHSTRLLSETSFNVDWHVSDESIVEGKIEDIIMTCQKINLTNNEYIPQVFVLKDNMFAFANSSGVMEPSPEFTGDWVIFEKKNDEYRLRVVMKLQ